MLTNRRKWIDVGLTDRTDEDYYLLYRSGCKARDSEYLVYFDVLPNISIG